METVLQVCLSNTIGALFLASAATLAGRITRRPAIAHFLWVLMLVKLLTPPVFQVPLGSQPRLSPPARTLTTTVDSRVELAENRSAASRQNASPSRSAQSARTTTDANAELPPTSLAPPWNLLLIFASHAPLSSYSLALIAWLGVACYWWIWASWRASEFCGLLRWARLAPDEVQDRASELARCFGLKRAPGVWFLPALISPMLWTLGLRPRLLFPETLWVRLDAEQRDALLAHEMAHLKRHDHWVRLLEIAVTGLYWWNPLVWWARRSVREAEERCCDALVVRAFPDRTKKYASAIIETIDCLAGAAPLEPIGATGLGTASQLKQRLIEILGGSPSRELSRAAFFPLLGVATAALAMGPAYVPLPSYQAMDIGTLGGLSATGFRLNNHGQVVGWSDIVDPRDPTGRRIVSHPFRTEPDRPINPTTDDLATLIGASEPTVLLRYGAYDINNRGQVIVWAHGAWSFVPEEASTVDRGFLIDGNRVVELAPGLAPEPTALNDAGQITGVVRRLRGVAARPGPSPFQVRNDDTDRIAFRAAADRPIVLARDTLGEGWGRTEGGFLFTTASDINLMGQVVGEAVTSNGSHRAFRTAPGRPIDSTTDNLGTLEDRRGGSGGRGMSRSRAVNNVGQVVGLASTGAGKGHHAFRTAPNQPIAPASDDLGTLGGLNSDAWGINNRGDVVGESDIPVDPHRAAAHAFLSSGGRMIDLNSCVELEKGWVLTCAYDINNRGQIVATARIDSANLSPAAQRAFLLTPAPAPAPLAMLLVGSLVTASSVAIKRLSKASNEGRPNVN